MHIQSVPRSLPHFASTLVGREAELDLLARLIEDETVHLITITGIAGVGKTRLAVHAVRSVQDRANTDALFVPLSTISDPDLVLVELGKALGIERDNLVDGIRARLESWQGVIILDNVEHVIDSASDIAAILPYSPNLTFVVTSQRPLHIAGERIVWLTPLALPDTDDAAMTPGVQLLVDRATELNALAADALHDKSTYRVLLEICRRLDGIPLAIELAASRLSSLSPDAVLAQLERGQGILSSPRRDVPERQRTMHAAISWSFQLLPPDLRRAFLCLGVFPGGFDLPLVERLHRYLGISSLVVDTISELMNLSLIRRFSTFSHNRYLILATLREFCVSELEAMEQRKDAEAFLAGYVIDLANQTELSLTSVDPGPWLEHLTVELPNIRAAIDWAIAHEDAHTVTTIAAGLSRFLEQIGASQEGIGWLQQAPRWSQELSPELRIRGILALTKLQLERRDIAGAASSITKAEQELSAHDSPILRAKFLNLAGMLAQEKNQLEESAQLLRQSAMLFAQLGKVREEAIANANLASVYFFRKQYAEAESTWLKVESTLTELGDTPGATIALSNLAAAANSLREHDRALEYIDQCIANTRRIGMRRDLLHALVNHAAILLAMDQPNEAETVLTEVIRLARELDSRSLLATGLTKMISVHIKRDEPVLAARAILKALDSVPETSGAQFHAQIAELTAELLVRTRHYHDAAAMLARAEAFTEEHDIMRDEDACAARNRLWREIDSALDDTSKDRARGTGWDTRELLRYIRSSAQRLATSKHSMLVTVGKDLPFPELTPREREILTLLTEGFTTSRMADKLSVSPRTVTTHIGNTMGKLNVSSRPELVAKALRAGL